MSESLNEKLDMTERNRVKMDQFGQTSIPWLFVGGDITGGTDAITAIADGHRAAKGIDKFLNKESK
jgi:glutamate synthase (NADPH/NADH) small chain